jgi:hypothetical protein
MPPIDVARFRLSTRCGVTALEVAEHQISKRGRSGLVRPDSGCAAGEVSWVQLDREGPGDPARGSRNERGTGDIPAAAQGARDDLRRALRLHPPVDGDSRFRVQGRFDRPVYRHRGRGDNLNHGPNGLAGNPGSRLTGRFSGHDHDVGDQELPAGQGYVNRFEYINIGACGEGRLGESAVQPVGRPLMAHTRRRAHDKNPTFVDLEASMITGIWQRLDIIGCPWPGVFYQRDAHSLTSRRQSDICAARPERASRPRMHRLAQPGD